LDLAFLILMSRRPQRRQLLPQGRPLADTATVEWYVVVAVRIEPALDGGRIRRAAVDVELASLARAEVAQRPLDAMVRQVRGERAPDARLVEDDARARHAPLPRQLRHHWLEPLPRVVEDAMPLRRKDVEDLLA